MNKYPHLFQPLPVAGALLRNRIFASPQGFYNVGPDAFPGDAAAAFYARKAQGGAAAVCVGDCIVDRLNGTHYPFLIQMEDANMLPGLSALANAVTRHGALASAELSHAGMYAQFSKAGNGGHLYGPVDMEGKYGHVEAMSEELLEGIIEKYGRAAAFAKRCGFTMVTIHAGHGWLLPQFMSPFVNKRTDRWGGSLENRMRLPLAVVDSVRRAVGPKFPIELRMSGSECCPGGYDIDEGVRFAMALDGKVDILHISAGHHEDPDAFIITHPTMFLPEGCNLRFAEEIKKHVKTPVATVGAFHDPEMMEETVASGKADIIVLGRQSLADPDLPKKARAGLEDEINRCIRCSACLGGSGEHRIFYCATNPEICRELEVRSLPPVRFKKTVLVVGGGVGGMQAALTASQRGHRVILCEKSDRLGGTLLCEGLVPFKKNLEYYIEKQARLVSRAPIDLRLSTTVTPEYAARLRPDVIIAALGAAPAVPPIPGIENALGAEEVYTAPERAGARTVILGGGLVGAELAVFLAMRGRKVTVVEIAPALTIHPFSPHSSGLRKALADNGVEVCLSTRCERVEKGLAAVSSSAGRREIACDTVIYATGQRPLRDEAAALAGCAGEFYQLGDCVTPANILSATQTAFTIANDIGVTI